MNQFSGSCSCGVISYRVEGDIKSVINCHCNLCRKMNGSAFSTYVAVAEDDFELLSGDVSSHQISENATKSFCGNCGTPIFNASSNYSGIKILHLGSLDDTSGIEPQASIYCESQLSWPDNLSKISKLPQGF